MSEFFEDLRFVAYGMFVGLVVAARFFGLVLLGIWLVATLFWPQS